MFVGLFNYIVSIGQIRNSLTEQKLLGKVKTVTDILYATNDTLLSTNTPYFSKTISNYNEKGFMVSSFSYNSKKQLVSFNVYKYDTIRGLKLEDKSCFPDSAFKEKSVYKYDDHGNMVEEKVYEKKDTLKPVLTNRYDIKVKDEPEFDSDEEKVEIVVTTKHKDFDQVRNWGTEITYEKKLPISVIKREIEYFKKSEY